MLISAQKGTKVVIEAPVSLAKKRHLSNEEKITWQPQIFFLLSSTNVRSSDTSFSKGEGGDHFSQIINFNSFGKELSRTPLYDLTVELKPRFETIALVTTGAERTQTDGNRSHDV